MMNKEDMLKPEFIKNLKNMKEIDFNNFLEKFKLSGKLDNVIDFLFTKTTQDTIDFRQTNHRLHRYFKYFSSL